MSVVHALMVIFLCTIAFAVYRAQFGQGTGPILLSYLSCSGRESSLLSCRHRSHSCSHSQDVGVVCPPCKLYFSLLSWYCYYSIRCQLSTSTYYQPLEYGDILRKCLVVLRKCVVSERPLYFRSRLRIAQSLCADYGFDQ